MHALLLLAATFPAVEMRATEPNYAPYVAEAAQRSGLPAALILAVMRTESALNTHAVSAKGAMGLMQLMPVTWQDLRSRFDLGGDPFDPHDNILAGAFYLRILYDTYGPGGFLAAYNAGPGRWENHRDTGRPLPAETRAYVAAITQKVDPAALKTIPDMPRPTGSNWLETGLFTQARDTGNSLPTVFAGGPTPFVTLSPAPPRLDSDAGQ